MKKIRTLQLFLSLAAEFAVLFGILLFQKNALMLLPLPVRAILMILMQWALLIVPFIFMRASGERLSDIGFNCNNLTKQMLTGILIAAVLSFFLTILPILLGTKDMVGATSYTKAWQFFYQFIYMTVGVALAEEIFYRGFLFQRFMDIKHNWWFGAIASSLIFGLSHIFNGDIFQVITTFFLGLFFCLCRKKLKSCTTLSLIVAHGFHNALITLFVAVL